MPETEVTTTAEPKKFGTFGGVFVPNVLTILGVIMFLRTGWVVGNAGLVQALVLLCIAAGITLLTSLSLSAIATNTKVGGGGAYFLISRSLGLEIGGSIGVPLYLAQALSVAFYIIGFTESLQFLFPSIDGNLVSTAVLSVLFVIAWLGADVAIKAQYFILGLLGLSLLSFFLGFDPLPDWKPNLEPAYEPGQDFWSVFAIYFPAVTGIMAGVSMSGDLKEPSRSIPRGTLWAVGVTFLVYVAQMTWFAMNAERGDLVENKLVMQDISVFPPLIFAGLWAATLSSALASLVAAPRTLQALSRDGVTPRFIGRAFGQQQEPRIGLVLSVFLAQFCILKANLDLIAPVITMFFLTTYGMVNLAAGLERWVANPSYRPTFRVHWLPSMIGAGGCAFVMFVLNPLAFIVASVMILMLYLLLTQRRFQTAWGDTRSGFWFACTRQGLLRFSASRQHVHNWRPVFLVLVGNPKTRQAMIQFANWIEARRGLLFLAQVVTGDWEKLVPRQAALQKSMEEFIRENRLSAVAKTVMTDDFERGVTTLLQVAGLGALQPNTVLMGWSDDAVKQHLFTRTVRRVLELKRNLIVFREATRPVDQLEPYIDIWWRAKENGSLMLTLAHLLQANRRWRDHTIRVIRIIRDEDGREEARLGTEKLLAEARFHAATEVVVSQEKPLLTIGRVSRRSAVCFVGVSMQVLEVGADPLADYSILVGALEGNLFLTKNWHDLEL